MFMTREQLHELMSDSAENAILTTRDEFNIELDRTPESVQLIDEIILKWIEKYNNQALENKAVFTICNIYGAYIGEIFREVIGGKWTYDESNPDAPYVLLEYGGHSYAFAGICYQRLVNDSQISVYNYFNQAVSNNTQ